jgi:hypothetical protein
VTSPYLNEERQRLALGIRTVAIPLISPDALFIGISYVGVRPLVSQINPLGIIASLSVARLTTKIDITGDQFRGRLSMAPCSAGQFVWGQRLNYGAKSDVKGQLCGETRNC